LNWGSLQQEKLHHFSHCPCLEAGYAEEIAADQKADDAADPFPKPFLQIFKE